MTQIKVALGCSIAAILFGLYALMTTPGVSS